MSNDEPQSNQNDEDGHQSPQSLSENQHADDEYIDALTSDTSTFVHPSTLHLKPVTWESLNKIDFPPDENFDIVDGLIVWIPNARGTRKRKRIILALAPLISLIGPFHATCGVDVEVESACESKAVNLRSPDLTITGFGSSSSSEPSSSQAATKVRKPVLRTKDNPPYAIIEIADEFSHSVDTTVKWLQYRNTGVPFYYIIDLSTFEASGQACVMVGSKHRFADAIPCQHGRADDSISSSSSAQNSGDSVYFKKVFRGDEQVNVGIFSKTPLRASQLSNNKILMRKVSEIKKGTALLLDLSEKGIGQEDQTTHRIAQLGKQGALLREPEAYVHTPQSDKHGNSSEPPANSLPVSQANESKNLSYMPTTNLMPESPARPSTKAPTVESTKSPTKSSTKSPTESPTKSSMELSATSAPSHSLNPSPVKKRKTSNDSH